MSNLLILKSISASNYASFADTLFFTTLADESKKEYKLNTFTSGDETINKVSYIYGSNGSGKTFFCKILREIQRLIFISPLSMIDGVQKKVMLQNDELSKETPHFAFDIEYNDLPTTFSIDLIIDEISYHYCFSILKQKIVYELLTKKKRRTEKILERTSSSYQDITVKSELKDFEKMKYVVREDSLCLAMASILNITFAQNIISGIQSINVLNMTSPRLNPADAESFSDERIKKYVNILQKADPTIRNMTVEIEEEEVSRQKVDTDDFENREIIETKTTVGVKTEHAMFDHGSEINNRNDQIDFFRDESLGTVKLFTTLPHLFDVLENGGVLVLDEIENGLHPFLVQQLISLFLNESTNPCNAQLICTTHQPLLLRENVKKDQVWILSKNNLGKSSIERLSNKKFTRAKINLTNQILDGAFGCNPELFF